MSVQDVAAVKAAPAAVYKGPKYGTGHQPKQGEVPKATKPYVAPNQRISGRPGLGGAGESAAPRNATAVGVKSVAKQHAAKPAASTKSHAAAVAAAYNWLNPQSPAQLAKQARATISASYKPSFGNLNSEQQQLAAINAKRAQDNVTYENWMAGQTSAILASGAQADSALSGQLAAANQAVQGAFSGQGANLASQADSNQGNVSDNSASTAFGDNLSNSQQLNSESLGVTDRASLEGLATSGDSLKATALNNESQIGANIAKQQSDNQTNLAALATQRSQLQLSKAGDIAKEIARLQGVEIQKAQNQQQITLAQETLGNTAANDAASQANTAASIKAGVTKAKIQEQEYYAGLDSRQAIAKYEQLGDNQRAQLAAQTGLTENQQRIALGNKNYLREVQAGHAQQAATKWKEEHPNSGSSSSGSSGASNSPLTPHEQQEDYNQIDATKSIINAALAFNNDPRDPSKGVPVGRSQSVYNTLLTGGKIQTGGTATNPTYVTVQPVPPAILNAALDLSNSRSGTLPPAVVAKLRQIGLRHINTRYTVG